MAEPPGGGGPVDELLALARSPERVGRRPEDEGAAVGALAVDDQVVSHPTLRPAARPLSKPRASQSARIC